MEQKLNVIGYVPRMIHINEYFDALLRSKSIGKIGETSLDETLLNSMPNELSKEAYV